MYPIRYVLTLVSEMLHSFNERESIQSLGYERGSIGAWFAWCRTTATYCAKWKHPLQLCVRRNEWEKWMKGGN